MERKTPNTNKQFREIRPKKQLTWWDETLLPIPSKAWLFWTEMDPPPALALSISLIAQLRSLYQQQQRSHHSDRPIWKYKPHCSCRRHQAGRCHRKRWRVWSLAGCVWGGKSWRRRLGRRSGIFWTWWTGWVCLDSWVRIRWRANYVTVRCFCLTMISCELQTRRDHQTCLS